MSKSTHGGKPDKPTPLYRLKAHANGKYYKWIKGLGNKYFGRWDDPAGADREFGHWAQQMSRGQEPTPDPDSLTLAELVDRWLTHQESRVAEKEIAVSYFDECRRFALEFMGILGATTIVHSIDDKQLSIYRAKLAALGGHSINNRLRVIRAMLAWAAGEAGLILAPLHQMRSLRLVPRGTMRDQSQARDRKHGTPLFNRLECRLIVKHATEPMRTMILLALNCGMSQREIAAIVWSDFDLNRGVLATIRPKTRVLRDAWLWPETVRGLRAIKEHGAKPKNAADADRVFLTRWGRPFAYIRQTRDDTGAIDKVTRVETITPEFRKLLARIDKAEGSTLARHGRNFRALRRTFRTIAEGANANPKRNNTIKRVMGHELGAMDPSYMRHMPRKRLRRICQYVFHRIFNGWSEPSRIETPAGSKGARAGQSPSGPPSDGATT